MLIKLTKFHRLFIIIKKPLKDKRGYFFRDFCNNELKKIKFYIKQINISFTMAYTTKLLTKTIFYIKYSLQLAMEEI